MRFSSLLVACLFFISCSNHSLQKVNLPNTNNNFRSVALDKVKALNQDLTDDKYTVDVAVFVPTNFDSGFDKVNVDQILDGVEAAKKIFAPVEVQINLLWVKMGEVPEKYLAVPSSKADQAPKSQYIGMYTHSKRNPSRISDEAKEAFEFIVPPHSDNHRTIYLIALQDVFYFFYQKREGTRVYEPLITHTSGMSFPSYSFGDQIPRRIRGVITLTNLSRNNSFKTIAHELGHKLMNVSHEYKDISPEFEVLGEGGLMLYGAGVDIPSGESGRWHKERLHLSPFLYKSVDGDKVWNPDYKESGHYFDPIYGDKCIQEKIKVE